MGEIHHLTEQEIAACVEAMNNGTFLELDQAIQNHIAECDSCAQEISTISMILDEEQALTATIDSNFAKEPSVQKNSFSQRSVITLLVAASLILFFGIRLFNEKEYNTEVSHMVMNDTTETEIIEQVTPEPNSQKQSSEKRIKTKPKKQPVIITKPANKELLAYAPNEQLEKLVERFNGSSMRGEEIEIKSPVVIESKIGEVTLEWTNPNDQLLIIEFFDNKGEKISEIETSDLLYQPKLFKDPGLYYWKLINEDYDLLFCGKIKLK